MEITNKEIAGRLISAGAGMVVATLFLKKTDETKKPIMNIVVAGLILNGIGLVLSQYKTEIFSKTENSNP